LRPLKSASSLYFQWFAGHPAQKPERSADARQRQAAVVSRHDVCQQAGGELLKHANDRNDDGRVAGLGVQGAAKFVEEVGHGLMIRRKQRMPWSAWRAVMLKQVLYKTTAHCLVCQMFG
jgi:hypothetical protein